LINQVQAERKNIAIEAGIATMRGKVPGMSTEIKRVSADKMEF
jgi:hypothetical protein